MTENDWKGRDMTGNIFHKAPALKRMLNLTLRNHHPECSKRASLEFTG